MRHLINKYRELGFWGKFVYIETITFILLCFIEVLMYLYIAYSIFFFYGELIYWTILLFLTLCCFWTNFFPDKKIWLSWLSKANDRIWDTVFNFLARKAIEFYRKRHKNEKIKFRWWTDEKRTNKTITKGSK